MEERWLPVVGYEGLYEVSDQGRVRSLARTVHQRSRPGGAVYTRLIPGRTHKTPVSPKGYPEVRLTVHGKGRTVPVHRLVLAAFVGPCPDGMEACHGDGDGANNRLANLRWDTHKANAADAERHGTSPTGDRNALARFTERQLLEDVYPALEKGETQAAIARRHGVVPGCISLLASGKTYKRAYRKWRSRA